MSDVTPVDTMTVKARWKQLAAGLKCGGAAGVLSTATLVAQAAQSIPSGSTGTLVMIMTGCFTVVWMLYAGRHVFHLFVYLARPGLGEPQRHAQTVLNRLVVADMLVVLLWGTLIAALWLTDAAILLLGSVAVRFALAPLAGATVLAAKAAGKGRVSEEMDSWARVLALKEGLRGAAPDRPYGKLMDWWDNRRTPVNKISAFVLTLVTSLSALVGAAVPVAVADMARQVGKIQRTRHRVPNTLPAMTPTTVPAPFTTSPAQPDPTYEAECGKRITPGDGAPRSLARRIRALWLGGEGIAGAGAKEAGCARGAHPEPDRPNVWLVEGVCGSELRSLAVDDGRGDAALLFQQAARKAAALASKGRLVRASGRTPVGRGDGYLLETPDGTIALLRPNSARGSVPAPTTGPMCTRVTARNVPYVEMPEALTALWFQAVRADDAWLWPANDVAHHPVGRDFVFYRDGGSDVVATGSCDESRCALERAGRKMFRSSGDRITPADLDPYLLRDAG